MKTLTDAQIHQQDTVQEAAYEMIKAILAPLADETPDWDMAIIGEVADAVVQLMVEHYRIPEEQLYPYLDE